MTWRRFNCLLDGLSPNALYRLLTRERGQQHRITGAQAPAFFASFPKAK